MWAAEISIDILDKDSGMINDDWGFTDFTLMGVKRRLYLRIVTLTVDVPCCNRIHPQAPNEDRNSRCILPPGHESADIHCMGSRQEPGIYRRIVAVTDRHPELEMGPHDEEI